MPNFPAWDNWVAWLDLLRWASVALLLFVGTWGLFKPRWPALGFLLTAALLASVTVEGTPQQLPALAVMSGLALLIVLIERLLGANGRTRPTVPAATQRAALLGLLAAIPFGGAGLLLGPVVAVFIADYRQRLPGRRAPATPLTPRLLLAATARLIFGLMMVAVFLLARFDG